MATFKELRKKRGSYKTKLTQFKNFLDLICTCKNPSSTQLSELTIRLNKIEESYNEYDAIQIEIEGMSDISDAECEEAYKDREIFEISYFATVARARSLLEVTSAGCDENAASVKGSGKGSVLTGGPNLKLPTIHLPTFSGRYENWLEFHDTYLSLIHSNDSIPKISKFHYLRSALKENAANVIKKI